MGVSCIVTSYIFRKDWEPRSTENRDSGSGPDLRLAVVDSHRARRVRGSEIDGSFLALVAASSESSSGSCVSRVLCHLVVPSRLAGRKVALPVGFNDGRKPFGTQINI
jgi:hypothetical protein